MMNIKELDQKHFSRNDSPEYQAFEAKFKPKRTTDDCYTPPEIYDVILKWVQAKCQQIAGLKVVRPFYPGGDYTKEDYTDAVVIDNPPFSILAEIKRFYNYHDVPYFLFGPALTLFSTDDGVNGTYIVANANITYANGANVRTGFISNLFGSKAIILAPDLLKAIDDVERRRKEANSLPSYVYPKNVISSALLNKYVSAGVGMEINRSGVSFIRKLDSQEGTGKNIFGSGFLISDETADELEEKLRRCKEMNANKKAEPINEIEWALSDREKLIIKLLGTPEGSDELILI